MTVLPSVFGLKGMAIAGAIGFAAGGAAAYFVTDAFSDAAVLRLEKAADAKTIADLGATIADRDFKLKLFTSLSAGAARLAASVQSTISDLGKAAADEEELQQAATDRACDYSDPEFGRVQSLIDRAGQAGSAAHPVARPEPR